VVAAEARTDGAMTNVILYCPHLNRDIRGLLNVIQNPQVWTGAETPKGEDGCLQCHQDIVRWAKAQLLPSVFVMEDDCQFTEHFDYLRWCEAAAWADDHGYDVLVGGCTKTYQERVVAPGLIEVAAFHSAHCIVYLASAYDKVLRTIQPFDVSVGKVGARVVMTWPFVAVQRPTYSGILKQDVDYVPLYQQHEQRLAQKFGLVA
jgi:hypothetical protein